jgi:hypothetical protein
MRPEPHDLLQRRREITPEADRPVVHEDVGGGLAVGDLGDPAGQAVGLQPGSRVVRPAGGEDDHAEALLAERVEEVFGARARWIPVVGPAPAGVGVQHAVQVDADDGLVLRRNAGLGHQDGA